MKQTLATALAVLSLQLLAVVTPAAAQSRETMQMMADVRMLQEQTQQLAIVVSALTDTVNTAIKNINSRLDDAANASRKALADQKLVIDNMSADLRVMRERVDDTNVRISTLGQEVEALRTSIPVAPAPVAVAPVEPIDPNAPPVAPPPAPLPSQSTVGLSPTRMYETALADYGAGQYALAITGFEAFLKTFPRSEMADDARFFIGETYYLQNRFADAIAAYNEVIQNYPGANTVPSAYYKRGLAQERLGQIEAARASWETAVKNFPDNTAGQLAKQGLDRLGRTAPPVGTVPTQPAPLGR
jgi:tol-pal system protein YbgF